MMEQRFGFDRLKPSTRPARTGTSISPVIAPQKTAVNMFVAKFARELMADKIKVNAADPGSYSDRPQRPYGTA